LGEGFAGFVGWVGCCYPDEDLLCVPGEERRQIWRIVGFSLLELFCGGGGGGDEGVRTHVEIKLYVRIFFALGAVVMRSPFGSASSSRQSDHDANLGTIQTRTLGRCGESNLRRELAV
jgi:hypothetical protein